MVEGIKKILPLNWFNKERVNQDDPVYKKMEKFRGLVRKNDYREKDDLYLREMRIVVLDTETTGLKPHAGDEIISIGACVLNGGQILPDRFHMLVNPLRPIPRFITELTGISEEMVADAPDFCTVICEFLEFLQDSVIVGHSIEFDMNFLNYKLKPYSFRINNYHFDTGMISRALYPQIKIHTLDSIMSSMGIIPEGRHTSLGDAILTANVFLNFLDKLEELKIRTLFDLRTFIKNAILYRF
ncbi:MAG: PolC-type DNA polymerase III [Bacillota bacterium]